MTNSMSNLNRQIEQLPPAAEITRSLLTRMRDAAGPDGKLSDEAYAEAVIAAFLEVDATVAALIDQVNAITERLQG